MTPVKLPIDPFLKPNLTTKLLGVGLVLTIIFILIALFSPLLQAIGLIQDPTDILSNYPLQTPSSAHWFGTNVRGYDVFSRTLFGARAALSVVFLATGLSLVIGVPLGLISGYLGGKIDRVLLFIMDTLYTLPGLLLSVALAFVLGRGILNVAIAVSIAYIPQYFRVVRNQTASVKNELFIEAARAIGASPSRILSKYLFFNVV
ncbi:MAG: ABC transporter permease, partial [Microcystis sp. M53603_WE2]|uniref:ABC transporter permease n=1 Tax=Microcystis sp. M53603_WE2 TaxID=3030678 RepID=UPI00258328F8